MFNPIFAKNFKKNGFLGKKLMFVYSQFEENGHRWRQNRDMILSKETDILQLMEMGTCGINRVRFMQGFFKEQARNFCMSPV
jgi:hypothetical protein